MEYKIWIASYLNSPPPYPVECYYAFVKIEYDDTIEYYDCYVPGNKTPYARRK